MMLANWGSGYALAWSARRRLLPVLLVVLIPMLVAVFTLDVVAAGSGAAVINGGFVFTAGEGPASLAQIGLTVLGWLLAVAAGSVLLIDSARPMTALGLAARHLPRLGVELLLLGVLGLAGAWLAARIAGLFEEPLARWMFLAGLAALALTLCRFVFRVLTGVFGGSSWALTRGRVFATAGAFLLGGIVAPALLATVTSSLGTVVPWPVVAELVDSALLIAVVAGQAGIIAHVYSQGRETAEAASAPPPAPRWSWALIGIGVVIPALVSATAAAANPYGAPTMQAGQGGPVGGAMAVAWPAGQHPIIVSEPGGIRFCNDDLCSSHVQRNGSPPVMERYGTLAISAQGVVAKAVLTGGSENGGPFIHYGRCTRDGGCQEAWLSTRASSDEEFVWPQLAVASTDDGGLWFALANPPPIGKSAPVTADIKLIRCDDFKCAKPHRFSLGSIAVDPRNGDGVMRYGELTIDADGRPRATFEIEGVLWTATCAPATCADPVVAVTDRAFGTLAPTVSAEPTREPIGLYLYIGERPRHWRYVLTYQYKRIPMDVVQGEPKKAMAVVSADGRVLVVREDRITLLPAIG